MRPTAIRRSLRLNRPIYRRTAAYGHFGRKPESDGGFSWEKTDLVSALKSALTIAAEERPRRVLLRPAARPQAAPRPRGAGRRAAAAHRDLPAPWTLPTLFGDAREVWLEIGFGAGEHLAAQAERHPDIGFIGCEPFFNGVAKLITEIAERDLDNVRVFRDDARLLLEALPAASIARAFVLFPDPWPKVRHHKRRILSREGFAALARVMPDGAELRVATDDPDYLDGSRSTPPARAALWLERRWQERPPDWPATRYEEKASQAGRKPAYLAFRRRATIIAETPCSKPIPDYICYCQITSCRKNGAAQESGPPARFFYYLARPRRTRTKRWPIPAVSKP